MNRRYRYRTFIWTPHPTDGRNYWVIQYDGNSFFKAVFSFLDCRRHLAARFEIDYGQ